MSVFLCFILSVPFAFGGVPSCCDDSFFVYLPLSDDVASVGQTVLYYNALCLFHFVGLLFVCWLLLHVTRIIAMSWHFTLAPRTHYVILLAFFVDDHFAFSMFVIPNRDEASLDT